VNPRQYYPHIGASGLRPYRYPIMLL
jgi:hypothetical protein